MKKQFLFLLNIFLIQISIAQDYKNSLNIGFGIATPLGEFGSKDINKPTSGAAISGNCFSIQSKGFYKNNFGVFSCFNYQSNQFDYDVARMLIPQGSNYYVQTDDWVLVGLMMGMAYEYRTNDNSFIHPKIGIGLIDAYSPQIQIYSGYTPIVTSKSANSKTFSGVIGFDFGWDYQRLRLQCMYDFIFAHPTFSQITYDQYNYPVGTNTFSQNMVTQNFSIAVGYRFK